MKATPDDTPGVIVAKKSNNNITRKRQLWITTKILQRNSCYLCYEDNHKAGYEIQFCNLYAGISKTIGLNFKIYFWDRKKNLTKICVDNKKIMEF